MKKPRTGDAGLLGFLMGGTCNGEGLPSHLLHSTSTIRPSEHIATGFTCSSSGYSRLMSQSAVVIFSRCSAIDAHQLTSGACVVEMPFQKFAPFFSSQELDTMTAAYNEAWPQLTQTTSIPAHRLSEMKAKL